ncbi:MULTISPECIES: carbon-nitrogen hydrolase family protein [Gordonibacter]|uniref:Carbon-nitrogen hydrolase family protein n=1 Tax=Gordonibacter faecis TaxID=3047475 RepID=A0ABT7DLT8_9ACTN|nr:MULTISPECIES: carbon-nitrogen hydrolase family protein [unclassified Gordonibacter]MDJ1650503.1 carbon-nitrogen hydrolase family protein [Gordonibacter sp. KGMB12511]HIW76639.1 carbon-nitrogen hydrolase family protein [Candidatus Gordonibacter avicola]
MVKIATVCMAADPRDKVVNRNNMIAYIEKAAEQGVDLIVFPESILTGVGTVGMQQFNSEDKLAIQKMAELVPEGESTQIFVELAKKYDMYICWGMAERNPERFDATHNVSVLVGPEGYLGKYRKVHLPLCERLYHYPGFGDYPVFDTRIGKIGLEICYDKCFPEVSRTLALKGAQIILGPICWPNMTGSLDDPDHLVHVTFSHARAMENMIFYVDANHCGPHMGGHSQIVGPNPGQLLATTGFDEGMAVAEVDIEGEMNRARIFSMGGSDLLRDRKAGTYGEVTKFNEFNPVWGGRVGEE